MNVAENLVDQMAETDDQSNLCVLLRPGTDGLEVCLVADEKGRWSIPGGHAKASESREDACKREVKEETGVEVEEVYPMILAAHAARKKPVTLFYAFAEPGQGLKAGGGDVTKAIWVPVNELGSLNGTDQLAIRLAVNKVHNIQDVVDDHVEVAETQGYAVANVAAPVPQVPGIHFRINGKASAAFAQRLEAWAESLNWPTTVVDTHPFISTVDALERASERRKLTPMMEGILHVSDALWRYESVIAPRLREGHIVIEIGPEIERQRIEDRGIEPDLARNLFGRVPKPTTLFTVGEDFDLMEFQCLKDAIEDMKLPSGDPAPEHYVDQLTPRQVQVPWKMEYVRENPDERDNPIVRCPKCKHEGPLMNDFSLLAAGFNGIVGGEPDDLNAQECGMCGAKMEWDDIDKRIVKI